MPGLSFYLICFALVAAAGLIMVFLTRQASGNFRITVTEFLIGLLVSTVVVVPLLMVGVTKIARADALTYNEWWSTLETRAFEETVQCEKNGSCVHTYQCDPYEEWVTKSRQVPYVTNETYANPDGSVGTRTVTKYRTEYYEELETRYHSCPYVREETSYYVEDGFGDLHTFGAAHFPASALDFRWTGEGADRPRSGPRGLPALPANVPQGPPQSWLTAKARIDDGRPGGVTVRKEYKNYILASAQDSYEVKKNSIERYRDLNALPRPASEPIGHYSAQKAYFVNVDELDQTEWAFALQEFNGHLGSERQGDLHVVFVRSSLVQDHEDYRDSLSAYWQSEELGRDTLSKNGIALIVFLSDAGLITDVEAFTGMPEGNETMVASLSSIEGGAPSPEALFAPEAGKVWQAIMGPEGFERVEMANYAHLYETIKIGTVAKSFIVIFALLIAVGIWALFMTTSLSVRILDELFTKNSRESVWVFSPDDESSKAYLA